MEQWEYKIVNFSVNDMDANRGYIIQSEELLNKYGNDGWECYSVYQNDTYDHTYYFKHKTA